MYEEALIALLKGGGVWCCLHPSHRAGLLTGNPHSFFHELAVCWAEGWWI